jgi:thiol:disulfide interchange protein DsbD
VIRRLSIFLLLLCALARADDLLHPSVAFVPSVRALDGQTLEVRFAIAKGYYLYRDKFRFSATPESVVLGAPAIPKGKQKIDDTFGKVEVHYGEVLVRVPVERNSSGPLPLRLNITSQGCADVGVCYPPQKQTLGVELPDPASVAAASPAQDSSGDESGRIAQLLGDVGLWIAAASFFGFGLLLAFTPCVFPMLPIISGIIVGAGRQGRGVTHARGFALSLAYVLGMATTYAAAGVAAGFSGTLLATTLQNAWVLGSFALVFVVLAFSMFGFYELQLPSFVQSKLADETAQIRGGSLPAVALIGALSAIIVGPCVAAPLAGALLYIGQSGDAVRGGVALFCMALGMGVPLLAIGASAGTLLPKSGAWMEKVKKVFGVVLLATALWIVSPLMPSAWNGVGQASDGKGLPFVRVATLAELDARIKASGKPVMLDFYADWCISCKEMERYTFADARVRQRLADWTLLQADVTANSDDDKALLSRFKLFGPPGTIFFDRQGEEVRSVRVIGFQDADKFLATLAPLR